jgi:hypothetical protein
MADTNVDKLTDEQIDDLGQDDLDRIQTDEESGESILKDPPKPKDDDQKETAPDPEKKEDDDKTPEETDDKKEGDDKDDEPKDEHAKIDKEIKDLEDIPKEDRTDVQVIELRRLNAERRMHQATKEAAVIKKERDELAEKLYNKELEEEDEPPEKLTQEEYDELPPDEQKVYNEEIKQYEDRVNARAAHAASNTFTNIAAFYKALKGIPDSVEDILKREETGDGKQRLSNAEFREFLKSDEFKVVDAEVTGMKKQYDGTYSVDQMMKAHFIVNKDKILSDAQIAGREQALNDIDGASNSDASKLDKIPKTEGKKGLKKVSDLSDEEIDNMSKEEYEQHVEQMEREGMA